MAFNSQSYHRNKAKREALAYLERARQATGEDVSYYVRLARSQWSVYLSYCRLDRMNADMAKVYAGTMKATDFIEKWS